MNESRDPKTSPEMIDLHDRITAITAQAALLSKAAADILARAKKLASTDADLEAGWRWRRAA